MQESTIALIIVGAALILYMIPRIPMSVISIMAVLAMTFFGIIKFETAVSGFSNSATLLVAGMLIISRACFSTGLALQLSRLITRFVKMPEKNFAIIVFVFSCALGIFLNGALIVPIMMTMVDCAVSSSGGKFTRKNLYFPVGMGATLGNNMTTISGTSTITALGIYYAAGYDTVGLFTPMLFNMPAFAVAVLAYGLCGYRFSRHILNYEVIPVDGLQCEQIEQPEATWRTYLTGAVLIAATAGMIAGLNYGMCAMLGAGILIVMGCVGEKEAYSNISWTTVILVASAIGISEGFTASGAGEITAEFLLKLFGNLAQLPFALSIIFLFTGTIISNVMSDNAAVAILVPIAIGLAGTLNCDPLPFVLATAFGVKDAISTPLAVATMTMIQPAGYRFKDYFLVAGMTNLIMVLVSGLMMKLVYF